MARQKKKGIENIAGELLQRDMQTNTSSKKQDNVSHAKEPGVDSITLNDSEHDFNNEDEQEYTLESMGFVNKNTSLTANIDTSGMTASQKKNLKKKLRKQEQKQNESMLNQSNASNHVTGVNNKNKITLSDDTYIHIMKDIKKKYDSIFKNIQQFENGAATSNNHVISPKSITKKISEFNTETDSILSREQDLLRKPIRRIPLDQINKEVIDIEKRILKLQKDIQRKKNDVAKNTYGTNNERTENEVAELEAEISDALRYLAYQREQKDIVTKMNEYRIFVDELNKLRAEFVVFTEKYEAFDHNRRAQNNRNQNSQNKNINDQNNSLLVDLTYRRKLSDLDPHSRQSMNESIPMIKLKKLISKEAYQFFFNHSTTGNNRNNQQATRKFERHYHVILENKISNISNSFTPESCASLSTSVNHDDGVYIYIVAIDENCVKRACKVFDTCDFSPPSSQISSPFVKTCISISGVNIGSIVGFMGSNLKKIEDKCDVYIWIDNDFVRIFGGDKTSINEACTLMKSLIESAKTNSSTKNKNVDRPRNDAQSSTRIYLSIPLIKYLQATCSRPFIKDLESDPAVIIRFPKLSSQGAANREGTQQQSAQVSIQADSATKCVGIEESIKKYINDVYRADYEAPASILTKLQRGQYPGSHRRSDVIVSVDEDKLLLLGKEESVKSLIKEYKNAEVILSRLQIPIKLTQVQLRVLSRNKREEIEKETGISIRMPPRSANYGSRGGRGGRGGKGERGNHHNNHDNHGSNEDEECTVTIFGDESQIENGKMIIERLTSEYANKCKDVFIRKEYISLLLSNRLSKLWELERKYNVSIILDKHNNKGQIIPSVDNINSSENQNELMEKCMKEIKYLQENELYAAYKFAQKSLEQQIHRDDFVIEYDNDDDNTIEDVVELKKRGNINILIGKQGGRLLSLVQQSEGGIHSLNIIDQDENDHSLLENPKIVIKAYNEESRDKIKKLIQSYIAHEESSSSTKFHGDFSGNLSAGRGDNQFRGRGRGSRGGRGRGISSSAGTYHNLKKAHNQVLNVDTNDEKAFPLLGAPFTPSKKAYGAALNNSINSNIHAVVSDGNHVGMNDIISSDGNSIRIRHVQDEDSSNTPRGIDGNSSGELNMSSFDSALPVIP